MTLTLDAPLSEADACRVTVQAWGVAAHPGGLAQVRGTIEDLLVNLSENASIGAEGRGYVLALDEEAYGADEKTIE